MFENITRSFNSVIDKLRGKKYISESDEFVHVRPDVGEYDNDEAIKGILGYRFRIVAWNKLYRANLWNGIRFPKGKINRQAIRVYRHYYCRHFGVGH